MQRVRGRLLAGLLALMSLAQGGLPMRLTVFDCWHTRAQRITLDAVHARDCAYTLRSSRLGPERQRYGRLVHTMDERILQGLRCKAWETRIIQICKATGEPIETKILVAHEPTLLPISDCRDIHNTHTFRTLFLGESKEFLYNPNTTSHRLPAVSFKEKGGIDDNHWCSPGVRVETENITYPHAAVQVSYKLRLERLEGIVYKSSGLVTIRGMQEPLSDDDERAHQIPGYGTIVWHEENMPCRDRLREIYRGNIWLQPILGGPLDGGHQLASVREDSSSPQRYGLVIKDRSTACGLPDTAFCYYTSEMTIFACFSATSLPRIVNQLMGETSFYRGIAIPLASFLPLHATENELHAAICRKEGGMGLSSLYGLTALQPLGRYPPRGKGYRLVLSGAVAHLEKCIAAGAKLHTFPNCTQEIPVWYNRSLYFAHPMSYTLQSYPTIIPCSRLMPPRWRIGTTWMCGEAHGTYSCMDPVSLVPLQQDHSGSLPRTLGQLSEDTKTKEEHRQFCHYQQSRKATIMKLVNELFRFDDPATSDLEHLGMHQVEERLASVFPVIWKFSMLFHGLLLGAFLYMIVNSFVTLMIRVGLRCAHTLGPMVPWRAIVSHSLLIRYLTQMFPMPRNRNGGQVEPAAFEMTTRTNNDSPGGYSWIYHNDHHEYDYPRFPRTRGYENLDPEPEAGISKHQTSEI